MLEIRAAASAEENEEHFDHMSIAEKALKALGTMNVKLQKEIFNFLALKLKLAFAKSGIGIGKDQTSNFMT